MEAGGAQRASSVDTGIRRSVNPLYSALACQRCDACESGVRVWVLETVGAARGAPTASATAAACTQPGVPTERFGRVHAVFLSEGDARAAATAAAGSLDGMCWRMSTALLLKQCPNCSKCK